MWHYSPNSLSYGISVLLRIFEKRRLFLLELVEVFNADGI